MGRPKLLTPEKFEEVITLLQAGCRLGESLVYVGVSRKVWHDTVKHTKGYRDKYLSAKRFINVSAKRLITAAILKQDVNTAKWWLEKKDKDFLPKQKNINENTENNEAVEDLHELIERMGKLSRPNTASKE